MGSILNILKGSLVEPVHFGDVPVFDIHTSVGLLSKTAYMLQTRDPS